MSTVSVGLRVPLIKYCISSQTEAEVKTIDALQEDFTRCVRIAGCTYS